MGHKPKHNEKKNYLDNIKSPDDLKNLSVHELTQLAAEIRGFLLRSVARSGGHLASNLGVVELTIALHYCYNAPADKIIWDVGHQAYTHKILTGRLGRFNTLRSLGGIAGFPKPEESEYDVFGTGHSSTSVSAAFGIAKARDLKGEKYGVCAVIGDGSMTGGLAYEALNNAGRGGADMLVVLNDNQMSISANVGALSRHLNDMRSAPFYIGAKRDVHKFLDKLPLLGRPIASFIEKIKNSLKSYLVSGVLFEELGFKYIGPIDGHNIADLIKVINNCKKIGGPVLLHVYTQKGKGYRKAEDSPETYHGVGSFDLRTGFVDQPCYYSSVFGRKLIELAEKDNRIVAVTASMSSGTGLDEFSKKFPERFFDVGIAEAHATTFCAGLAKAGLKPVFAAYSTFLQRAYDEILHDVCVQNLPVVFAVDRAGVVGPDGATHQGLFDLSYLSHMPNMTVIAPRCGKELEAALEFALAMDSPAAIRYPKGGEDENDPDGVSEFVLGESEIIAEGGNIAIISVGAMFAAAGEARDRLKEQGYEASLVNARFVKPISDNLIKWLGPYKFIFTAEDNVRSGGYGEALMSKLNDAGALSGKIVRVFAFPDKFIEHGTREELIKICGLDADGIYNKIIDVLTRTKN